MGRLLCERLFHDAQAKFRARTFQACPGALRVDENGYLDHEDWIRPAFEQLGLVAGLDVLDLGCGHGMAAVLLARRGARVTALELSGGYLAETARRAEANGVRLALVQADGQRLPFADASFDRVWGNAILHHLDLNRAAAEVRRVLRPGGRAVFCEPWGDNPLLSWVRRHCHYPGKGHTPDETPLRWRDVRVLARYFPMLTLQGYQLFSMARRVLRRGFLVQALGRLDALLLPRVRFLQRFCRYMVFTLPR
jgi:SAM-dependent methyltransferase